MAEQEQERVQLRVNQITLREQKQQLSKGNSHRIRLLIKSQKSAIRLIFEQMALPS